MKKKIKEHMKDQKWLYVVIFHLWASLMLDVQFAKFKSVQWI